MYGQAGWKHTPGMPKLGAKDAKAPKLQGTAGPQTSRIKAGIGVNASRQRYKEAKRAKDE